MDDPTIRSRSTIPRNSALPSSPKSQKRPAFNLKTCEACVALARGPHLLSCAAQGRHLAGRRIGNRCQPPRPPLLLPRPLRLQKRPLLKFLERLAELLLRVHHDRTVPGHWLL